MHYAEHKIQSAIFQWARMSAAPELRFMFAVPNGLLGKLTPAQRGRAVAEGYTAGVPDICLPIMRGRYGALWIETKSENGRLSDAQEAFHEFLTAQGHLVRVCRNPVEAINLIKFYLEYDECFSH